jgi:prepilin-type N-terminal cleavage/methylation domain-containing protein
MVEGLGMIFKIQAYSVHRVISQKSGFTLLEVLMGMVIMTVGLLGLAMMQGNSVQGNSFSNRFTEASFLAQMQMEDLMSEPFYANGGQPNETSSDLNDGANATQVMAGGMFSSNYTVDNIPNSPYARAVTVTVNWTDALDGKVHNVSYSTRTRGWGN